MVECEGNNKYNNIKFLGLVFRNIDPIILRTAFFSFIHAHIASLTLVGFLRSLVGFQWCVSPTALPYIKFLSSFTILPSCCISSDRSPLYPLSLAASAHKRYGASQCGAKSNAVNLILRLFWYHFLHMMSL